MVVIPALAESTNLFRTLESISRNDRQSLAKTMVICVINNGAYGNVSEWDCLDNERTLSILRRIMERHTASDDGPWAEAVAESGLSLGFVDASSHGKELPFRGGGVGLARKIGMDRALEIFDYREKSLKLLLCLDADTLVDSDWISVVRRNFENRRLTAAAIEFSHQAGATPEEHEAICLYETFIRYKRLGLEYAKSRYAYHSIGSTMAVTAEGYAAVRGMSRREAGEDFHFLNKIAKIDGVFLIDETRVYPSPRPSRRVPFGTGQRVSRIIADSASPITACDPEVFRIMREWLICMDNNSGNEAEALLRQAQAIHGMLPVFLKKEGFENVWRRMLINRGKNGISPIQASRWFDALKTFKLTRFMTLNAFPPKPLYDALKEITSLLGIKIPALKGEGAAVPDMKSRSAVLACLRRSGPE